MTDPRNPDLPENREPDGDLSTNRYRDEPDNTSPEHPSKGVESADAESSDGESADAGGTDASGADAAGSQTPERRALSEAIRDALAARAETGEQAFTPVRTRPALPRALDTSALDTSALDTSALDTSALANGADDGAAPADRSESTPDSAGDRPTGPDAGAPSARDDHDSMATSAEAPERDDAPGQTAPITSDSPASATWADVEPIPEHDLVETDDDSTSAADRKRSDRAATPAPASRASAGSAPGSGSSVDAPSGVAVPAIDGAAEVPAPTATATATETAAAPRAAPTDAIPLDAEDDPDGPSSLEASVRLDEPRAARRRFTGRGAIVVGARALAGIVGIGIAVVAIAGSTIAPLPRYTSTPPEVTISPVAAAQQRVCPGPLLRLGTDEGQEATSATSVGRPTEEYQAVPRDAEADALSGTDNASGVPPLLLTLPPGNEADDGIAAVAGSQAQSVRSGDLVGLASAECAEAGGDTWLVGGSTDVGRTTLITLSNPTTVIATVRMRVFGPAGEVVAPGLDGIVVPPGSQRIFSLAGFAPQVVAPVVRVESRGGLVVANLQQTTVRTLDPGGVDIVGATHAPATDLTIPGVVVSGSAEISGAQDQLGYDDLQATLRIFNPGTDMTTATVRITPARGTAAPPRSDSVAVEGAVPGSATDEGGFEVDVAAGQVIEVPFPGLADGDYTVSVQSRSPVVAGVRVSTVSEDGATDFAWLPAGAALRDRALVSIASGPSPVLRLANPSDEERMVTISTADGDLDVELEPGESVPTPMRAGRDATLTGASGMVATVTYLGSGQVSAFGLTSPGPASGDIVVYR